MQTILQLLPFVFNSRGSNRTTGEANEYAASYGKFKPVYYVVPWPPRNDADAQRFYNHIRTVAWYLDAIPYLSQAGLPFRVGFDDIIGAIPFYGDFIGVILAAYMVFLCFIFGTPRDILGRMVVNVAIDGGVGIIPVLGDVFDTLFKSNLRNLALFETWLLQGGHKYNIQVTPSDEFLPRKKAAKAAGGLGGFFSGLGGGSGNQPSGSGRDKYKTGASSTSRAAPPQGTYRFNRADLDTSDLGLD